MGCSPGTSTARWGQLGCGYFHTLLMSCVWNRGTSRCQGSSAEASPQQIYFKHKQALHQAACDGVVAFGVHEGCRTTCFFFSARFLPTPPEQQRLQKSSKPVAKVAVLCSPYKGGMPRTCTNMSLLPITFSWSRTVFFFIPEAMWCYSLDHWLWSWLCMYWWGIFCLLIALQHSLLACTPSTCSIALIYEQDTWEVWSFHIICTEIVLPSF